jgi:probable HAF family extracellular repeat protein
MIDRALGLVVSLAALVGPAAVPAAVPAAATTAPAAAAASAPRCHPSELAPTPLGTLGGSSSAANDMNDRGQVVGASETSDGGSHAFLWQRGTMTDLTPSAPPGFTSSAREINRRGQILIETFDGEVDRPLLWTRGRTVDLTGGEPGVHAVALNDRGQVVLQRRDRLELWEDGAVRTIVEAASQQSLVFVDLSDRGHVALYRMTPASHGVQIEPFVWHRGTLTLMIVGVGSPITYIDPIPAAVDDRGRVLINLLKSAPSGGFVMGAVLWDDGDFVDLGALHPDPPPVRGTTGSAVNDRRQIVGASFSPEGTEHAFLWERGHMVDLGALPDATATSNALRVNDRGHVLGTYSTPLGDRTVLWRCGTATVLGPDDDPAPRPVDLDARGRVVTNAVGADGISRSAFWSRAPG